MVILHVHTGEGICAECTIRAATVFRKKYPHASLRRSCVLIDSVRFFRDVWSIFRLK